MGLLENKGKVMWQSGGIGLSSASGIAYSLGFSQNIQIFDQKVPQPRTTFQCHCIGMYWDIQACAPWWHVPDCPGWRKRPKIMQTSICRRVAFCTALLINRIMCFRMSHMASLCVCLVSCTYHWPIPVLRALHLAAYGLNLGYLLKPCVSY